MNTQCPISSETVNQSIVRTTAFFTVLLLLAGLFSNLKWIALLLCFDFFIRGFTDLPLSPLRRAARAQVKLLRRKPKPIDAAPKRFAARLGFVVSAVIAILAFSGFHQAAHIVTQLFVLLAGLEAFLGICLGCRIYSLLLKHKNNRPTNAE